MKSLTVVVGVHLSFLLFFCAHEAFSLDKTYKRLLRNVEDTEALRNQMIKTQHLLDNSIRIEGSLESDTPSLRTLKRHYDVPQDLMKSAQEREVSIKSLLRQVKDNTADLITKIAKEKRTLKHQDLCSEITSRKESSHDEEELKFIEVQAKVMSIQADEVGKSLGNIMNRLHSDTLIVTPL